MRMPATNDTIVAVASGWEPAPTAIVRLSGPQSAALAERVGATPPEQRDRPQHAPAVLSFAGVKLPADGFWFWSPRSYTGQDLVELHTVGCLPLVRLLAAALIEHGARRALPGEFTARAYLAGKLTADQVDAVQMLVNAEDEATMRRARRLADNASAALLRELEKALIALLAQIEAGIDFTEEEDVRFVTADEVADRLDALRSLAQTGAAAPQAEARRARPHIALAGLPNAGKSTLFNALLGYERAIVAPVLGTTRDVLSAELALDGLAVVLQDCAGLGASEDELELAAHLAAERAADEADLVLWVHDSTQPWRADESATCRHLGPARVIGVLSKSDLPTGRSAASDDAPAGLARVIAVSAAHGAGLAELRKMAGELLAGRASGAGGGPDEQLAEIGRALARARAAIDGGEEIAHPELIAMELRAALAAIESLDTWQLDEQVLDRIFADFCVGK